MNMEDSLKHIDPYSLNDVDSLRSMVMLVLRALESMSKELLDLKDENGKLKDEINRLKGEKGRPEFTSRSPLQAADGKGKAAGGMKKRTSAATTERGRTKAAWG